MHDYILQLLNLQYVMLVERGVLSLPEAVEGCLWKYAHDQAHGKFKALYEAWTTT